VLDSIINFEKIFEDWQTKNFWIRFNMKDMQFFTVPKTKTIKQVLYKVHNDINNLNIDCWRGVLEDPTLMTVSFEETASTVSNICNRRVDQDIGKVSYQIDWKSANGRIFPK